jgi:hypothetical protein
MIDPKYIDEATATCLRMQLASRMEGLRADRMSFWAHWGQLAEMFLPRRYKWFVTANQYNRGSQMNQSIVDETGVLAARACAAGMMSGMTSPTKVWFDLGLKDLGSLPFGPAKDWLDECRHRILRVLAQSNFYTCLGQLYEDNVVFSSAAMLIYEDTEQVIRCYNPCLGEFFFGASNRQIVDSLYREYAFTVEQAVQEFGLDKVSDQTRQAYMAGGGQRTQELIICHAIEPNSRLWMDATVPLAYAVPPSFEYREVYWEQGQTATHLLRCAGYREKPFVGARWAITGNDAYGRGPGMDALPAVRQLQIEQRRKAEAIDKLVRPPMVGSVSMRNEPASILPGAITYVSDLQGNNGFRPAFQVDPRIAELTQDLIEVQDRVRSVFFVDLFMMIASLDTVRTATEIDARREEKLIQLGPVIERFENEVLDPIIGRVFSIMNRRGLLPPPPPEIQGQEIDVQYISMLAEAQRAARTAGTERLLALAGNLAAVDPSVMDSIDTDALIADYADAVNVTPRGIRGPEEIAELRANRAQQEQVAQAAELGSVAAQSAKVLSETTVGAGQNALELMMGGL